MDTAQLIFFVLCMAAIIGAVVLLGVVIRRDRYGVPNAKRDDIASMMILLQTMRDLLEQQKGLARELNKALDSRVELIKQTVESARQELRSVRDLTKQTRDDLERLKIDMTTARVAAETAPPASNVPANVTPMASYTPVPIAETEAAREHDRPVLRVLAMPREPETGGDLIDSWVGLDFAGDDPNPLGFDVPDTEPEVPHDADAARHAFRALLDMTPAEQPPIKPSATAAPPPHSAPHGNGRAVPPIHARVYEYNDAGMTVPQIAQELGIGKGEVRLILSLRK